MTGDDHATQPAGHPPAAVAAARRIAEQLGLVGVPVDGMLARAMVHRSWAFENGGVTPNERLEFVGDAVLSLAVAESLYAWLPDQAEGRLAKVRGQAVRESELADVARRIGLGELVLLGVGEAASGGADKDSILSDAFEAVLGAVYVDAGWDAARALVGQLMGERLEALATGRAILDHKTALQELLASRGTAEPSYAWTAEGPDHAKTFTATAHVEGELVGTGTGTSKKRAEEAAAADAWRQLAGASGAGGAAIGGTAAASD